MREKYDFSMTFSDFSLTFYDFSMKKYDFSMTLLRHYYDIIMTLSAPPLLVTNFL